MSNEESERIATSQDVINSLHDKIDEQHARIVELEAQKQAQAAPARPAGNQQTDRSLNGLKRAQEAAEKRRKAVGLSRTEATRAVINANRVIRREKVKEQKQ